MSQDASPDQPLFASCSATTYNATFDEDVAACRDAGVRGLGIWEYKLTDADDAGRAARLADAGMTATNCFPNTPGVIAGNALFAQPKDPAERLRMLCDSIRRFAAYNPVTVICLAGAPYADDPAESRRLVVDSFREASKVADGEGVKLAIEVISPGTLGSQASTITEALELAADAGGDNMGVLVDAWHSAGVPGIEDELRTYIDRVFGIQVCDRKSDFRSWYDRAYPGEGVLPLTELIKAAHDAGYRGWYEMELFSDDGKFGNDYHDSLWKQPPVEVLRRSRETFLEAYAKATAAQ